MTKDEPHAPTSPLAQRLMKLCIVTLTKSFGGKFMYVRGKLPEWGETLDDLIPNYKEMVHNFVELVSDHLGDREWIERLISISDPGVIYVYKCLINRSVSTLDCADEKEAGFAPELDSEFFRKYALYSLESF